MKEGVLVDFLSALIVPVLGLPSVSWKQLDSTKPSGQAKSTHSPPQRLGTLDRVSGQRAWRKVPCKIERVASYRPR